MTPARATEDKAMERALELATRGWGRVQPNPLCGAVVLAGDEIVGEGFHGEYGGPHAERLALDAAGSRAKGGTLVVTLEPCIHQGKQPACVPAVIEAGIRRAVVAIRDPDPVAGGGARDLSAAGVDVDLGLKAEAARAANAIFLHHHQNRERPFVGLKLATSLDGRIADRTGKSRWVSGRAAQAYVHWLRAGFDAIAVGGRTAREDDPSLTVRGEVEPRAAPVRIVFDRGGQLPDQSVLATTARATPTWVVVAPEAPVQRRRALAERGVELIEAASLGAALEALRRRGLRSLLVEGGGRLAGALLSADLVDRYYAIQSPLWLGADGIPAVAGLTSHPLAEAPRWRVVERRAFDQDTLLVFDRIPCSPAS